MTQWIAAHHADRVRSMILVDTTIPLYSTTRRSRVANLRLLSRAFLRTVALRQGFVQRGLRAAYFHQSLATAEVADAYLDRLRVEGIEDAYYGLTAKNGLPPAEIDFAAVQAPALVIWGEKDMLTPISNGRRIAAALGNARFLSIADCGHVPMEEKPHELLAVMLPFLRRKRQDKRAVEGIWLHDLSNCRTEFREGIERCPTVTCLWSRACRRAPRSSALGGDHETADPSLIPVLRSVLEEPAFGRDRGRRSGRHLPGRHGDTHFAQSGIGARVMVPAAVPRGAGAPREHGQGRQRHPAELREQDADEIGGG